MPGKVKRYGYGYNMNGHKRKNARSITMISLFLPVAGGKLTRTKKLKREISMPLLFIEV